MNIRIQCLCIDTTDPAMLAGFWQEALGWVVMKDPDGNYFDVRRWMPFLRIWLGAGCR